MSQNIRTELMRVIVREIETAIQERCYGEMVIGGQLYPIPPAQLFMKRKFGVGELTPPSLFITRGDTVSAEISGNKADVTIEYHFAPMVFSMDMQEGEDNALAYADNIYDMFISEGDRSLGGKIYDVKYGITSPAFALNEKEDIHFAVTRLRFEYIKRTK